MKKTGILIMLFFLTVTDLLVGQTSKKVSLFFPKEKVANVQVLNSIQEVLAENVEIGDIRVYGVPLPIIMIEPDPEYLSIENISYETIYTTLESTLNIPIYTTSDKKSFFCLLKDYKKLPTGSRIENIGMISLKGVGLNNAVQLMQVANIYLKLRNEDVLYQNKKVYSISFDFLSESKDGLEALLKKIDTYQVNYEVGYEEIGQRVENKTTY